MTSTDADAAIGAFLALPAAAILQAGLSVYLTRHEVVDSDLTREQPPSARTAKVASTATARWPGRRQGGHHVVDSDPHERSPREGA